jgi:RND superfamily putative drug exporter
MFRTPQEPFAPLDPFQCDSPELAGSAACTAGSTLVRTVLLPASMKLLGSWNWYLPTWLSWIPEVEQDTRRSSRTKVR